MKKTFLPFAIAATLAMGISGLANAAGTDLNVNFTANIRETTCDMKLVGGVGSDTVQTLTIGDSNGQVRFDDVRADTATANFKIVLVECPESLTGLKTTVQGTPSGYMTTALINSIPKTSGGADYSAIAVARASDPTTPFVINAPDDSGRLVWTSAEIKNKEVPLVAIMKETKAGAISAGKFEAVATFQFTYE